MAIPKDIQKIDDLFESAYKMLTNPGDRYPTRILNNLKNKMKMFTGQDYDSQTVRNAFDRYNFKNRFTYDNDFVATFNNTADVVPEIGQNFIDDKGRYYIFEKFTKDDAGQNVYQFRNNVGTKERFTGSGYSHKLSKTDNIYDLKSAQEYGDDMYELYVHKQKFGTLNVNDRAKYYEENILPIQQRIKERQQKINFDNNYYHDYRGEELMKWSNELSNDKQINRQQHQSTSSTSQQTSNSNPDYSYNRNLNQGDTINLNTGDIIKEDGTVIHPETRTPEQEELNREVNEDINRAEEQRRQQREVEYDPHDASTWTDEDIENMSQGDPDWVYEDLHQQRDAARNQNNQQQNTGSFNENDPSTWTDDDIRRMSDGDPYVAQELINQRDAARNQGGNSQQQQQGASSFNENDPSTWTDDDIRRMSEGDPYVAQDLINQRDAARGQSGGQDQVKIDERVINHEEVINQGGSGSPEQTVNNVEQTVDNVEQNINKNKSDWRKKVKDQARSQRGVNTINVNEANAKVNVDTSDPYNIYKTIEDADGNVRTQHWRRKGEWSGDTELISDISQNQYGSYDNITGQYTGQDRSPIDWINADEWDDDYILGRAGDDEDLLNSMMSARERKIQENERYRQSHPEFDADTSTNDVPSTDDPIPDNTHSNVDTRPQVNPDDPLTWTEEYMDEMSEGDPAYYDELNKKKLNAEKAERLKNIDPNNPTTWTDEYINETAKNQDEINEMTRQMREAKNLDTVDEINKQRQTQRQPNRQERRQQQRENRQKGNTQEKKTKKQKEKDKRNKKFNDRQRAMGNDPDEARRTNREYNEEQKEKRRQRREQEQQQQQNQVPQFDENDPTTWTDEDIADMADGDPELYDDLMKRRESARGGTPQGPANHVPNPDDYEFADAPEVDLPEVEAPDTEWVDDLARNADDAAEAGVRGMSNLGKAGLFQSGLNLLGAVSDYKAARRKGHGVVSSAIRAGAQFALYEALGLWAIPVTLLQHAPGAIIKGADMLYKENRRMNSAANNQVFGDAEFLDTQQLATMRQSGMEMAKMAQYNLQQTLMGNEAQYLHR